MFRKDHGGLYKAPTMGERKKRKAKRNDRDQINLLILDLKESKLKDSGRQEGGKTFHELQDSIC